MPPAKKYVVTGDPKEDRRLKMIRQKRKCADYDCLVNASHAVMYKLVDDPDGPKLEAHVCGDHRSLFYDNPRVEVVGYYVRCQATTTCKQDAKESVTYQFVENAHNKGTVDTRPKTVNVCSTHLLRYTEGKSFEVITRRTL